MCILCVQIDKELMTPLEIARAFREINQEDPHVDTVTDKLLKNGTLEKVLSEYLNIVTNNERNGD